MTSLGEALELSELSPAELLEGQEKALARDIARLHSRSDEFVRVHCPACALPEGEEAFTKYGFSFEKCPRCRTIYMNPRPSETLIEDYYRHSENYRYWTKHIFPSTEKARTEKIHRPRLSRVLDYCSHFDVPRNRLVEVGPGFGTFFALARDAFEEVVVIEPTPELAEHCRTRGAKVHELRVEDSENGLGADVVCAFEVIEHLFEPRSFIEACSRHLAPGGLLILSCPNGLGFDIRYLGAASQAVDNEHLNLFNPQSLSRLVEAAGLEVVELSTPGRLDAELVRTAALRGEVTLDSAFLAHVLIDEWERLGPSFQQFIAETGLSSHMWLAARKPG